MKLLPLGGKLASSGQMGEELLSKEIKAFLAEHQGLSPEAIALMAAKRPDLPMGFVAQQVKGRQRVRQKLPSWAEHPEVVFPPSLNLEQCSSELTARYKASALDRGRRGADLTGGFGVDGRFLAERFETWWHFERDPELAAIAQRNFSVFGLERQVSVFAEDGPQGLARRAEPLDLIYVDPSRRDERSLRVSALEDCEPNVVPLWAAWLERAPVVALKASPGLDLTAALRRLPQVAEAHVISVRNECKELLLIARRGWVESCRIHCVDLHSDRRIDRFDFTLEEEAALETVTGIPDRYLYEPNASILKAGAFKTVARRYGLRALGPRTRLYCGVKFKRDFPGRVFEIEGRGPLNATTARRLFSPERRANVISRNSGLSTEELRRKLKLKEGGERFAIGAAVSDIGRQLYACRIAKLEDPNSTKN